MMICLAEFVIHFRKNVYHCRLLHCHFFARATIAKGGLQRKHNALVFLYFFVFPVSLVRPGETPGPDVTGIGFDGRKRRIKLIRVPGQALECLLQNFVCRLFLPGID